MEDLIKHYEFPNLPLNFSNKIDEGSFANIYLHIFREKPIALKVFKASLPKKKMIQMCINLKKLKHVNVVRFKGYCFRPSIIGFEYCCVNLDGDDVNNLSQLIAVLNSDNIFELNDRLNYISQVLNGLAYLHQENIIHCDLKPCNMLVNGKSGKDLVVKIADFDELLRLKQTFTSSCTTYSQFRGMTLSYTAPELCQCIVQRPSKESDIYSFGVSAFEILSDASAWDEVLPLLNDTMLLNALLDGKRPNIKKLKKIYSSNKCEHVILAIIECWDSDFTKRPTSEMLKERFDSMAKNPSHQIKKKVILKEQVNLELAVKTQLHKYPKRGKKVEDVSINYVGQTDPPGFQKHYINQEIGFGVFTLLPRKKGEFLLEYRGKMMTAQEGKLLEENHKNLGNGCYQYFFTFQGKKCCIDGTEDTNLGVFVNDSKAGNCAMHIKVFCGMPHLCLYALKDIEKGTELRYNYNSVNLWWRKLKSTRESFKLDDLKQASLSSIDNDWDCAAEASGNKVFNISNELSKEISIDNNKNISIDEHIGVTCLSPVSPEFCMKKSIKNDWDCAVVASVNKIDEQFDVTCLSPVSPEFCMKKSSSFQFVEKKNNVLSPNHSQNEQWLASSCYGLLNGDLCSNFSRVLSDTNSIDFHIVSAIPDQVSGINKTCVMVEDLFVSESGSDLETDSVLDKFLIPVNKPVQSKETKCDLEVSVIKETCVMVEDLFVSKSDSYFETDSILDKFLIPVNKPVQSKETKCDQDFDLLQLVDEGKPQVEQWVTSSCYDSLNGDLFGVLSDTKIQKKKSQRPQRYCVFCKKSLFKLKRHIKRKHKDEIVVKEALLLPKELQVKAFAQFRREGIVKYNKDQAILDFPMYISERALKKQKDLTKCSFCKIVVVKRTFSRHKKVCQLRTNDHVVQVPLTVSELPEASQYNNLFITHIIGKFRNDKIGKVCRTDQTILKIGSKFFWKLNKKQDKSVEVYRSIRNEMRRLAHCYTLFLKQEGIIQKHNNSLDMFNRVNFDMLSNVIEVYTKKDDADIKAGLKQNLYYLLKKSATVMQFIFYSKGMDAEAEDVQKFIYTLKCWQEYLFGDATYKLNIRSQVNLRKPAKLPREQDLLILRNYILETMKLLCDDYEFHDLHSYVKLRNCACARLTLLCGRRGGEPARMLLTDWNQAYNNEWIDSQRVYKLGKLENFLIKTMKIAYMTGKGNNHLVPVLIPQDTVDAIIKIASNGFREQAGVSPQNKFLFASAQDSDAHISGWHVVHELCSGLPLKNPNDIIATNNRHRISTLFAALDVPKRDRELFYSHMGHSEQMNINFYQAPLALEEITKVGKHLLAIDAGETESSIYSEPEISSQKKKFLETSESEGEDNSVISSQKKKFLETSESEGEDNSVISSQKRKNLKTSKREGEDNSGKNNNDGKEAELFKSATAYNDFDNNRFYTQWNKKQTNDLLEWFASFLNDKEREWPDRRHIEKFISICEIPFDYGKVRTKLTNERLKLRAAKIKSENTARERIHAMNL
nr:uncharacterized protein LOC105844230 isoform X4 [Hydra vulgaris]XP_047145025.1 uncharacterized protein LOC105844230 isoform X5 [Hydra vulgaris]